MSAISEAKTLLTSIGSLYESSMPDTPDDCVCIYATGGYPRSLSGTQLEEPTFMIKVRKNQNYAAGVTLCETIKDLLHGKSTTKLLLIEQQSDVLDIGRDEKNRHQWTINFRCYYRK